MSETNDPTGCKAQAVAKKSTEFKIHFDFVDTSPKALYVGLVLLNFLFLMIFGYNATTNDGDLFYLVKILQFSMCFIATFSILCATSTGFVFILQCYTITGYKSIWLFIIAFFIPQIFCAVFSTIYIGL